MNPISEGSVVGIMMYATVKCQKKKKKTDRKVLLPEE